MVCAENLFKRKGAKPILQVTVHGMTDTQCQCSLSERGEADFASDCITEQPLIEVSQVLWSTWDDRGATAPALKMDDVVCAHNFLGERERSRFCK